MNAITDLILKEGWRPVAAAVASALLLALLDLELFSLIALLISIALVWTYRKPVRSVSHFEKGSVTTPADGKVRRVETLPDGTVVVEIESGFLDGSVLTAPFDGTVPFRSVVRGARLGSKSPLFETLNERAVVEFEDAAGRSVRIVHRLLRAPAPIVTDACDVDSYIVRGTRYGVMVQGCTRIHLPPSTRVAVNPGETVRATETLLGYMG